MNKQDDEVIKWNDPFFSLWKVLSLAQGIYANSSPYVMKGTNIYMGLKTAQQFLFCCVGQFKSIFILSFW